MEQSDSASDSVLEIRSGVQSAVDRTKRLLRASTHPTLLTVFCAGACAPVLAAALGAGAVSTAALGALGSVSGGALTKVVTDFLDRLRHRPEPAPSPAEAETALAAHLDELLAADARTTADLRRDLAALVTHTDAVPIAIEAAISAGNEELCDRIVTEFRTLADRFPEFAFVLTETRDMVAELRDRYRIQESLQRNTYDLVVKQSVRLVRFQHELDATSGGDGPGQDAVARPDDSPPYLGLLPFRENQADLFFGRAAATAKLIARAESGMDSGVMLAVTGASGAGKSSLLRAGFIAEVATGRLAVAESRHWPRIVMTPGASPLEELAGKLADVGGPNAVEVRRELAAEPERAHLLVRQALPELPEAARLVLVVDQFEELFTLTGEAERQTFITVLDSIATGGSAAIGLVVFGVHGDYVGQCARYPELVTALETNAFYVETMTPEELRQAITGPAAMAGLELEAGLDDDILGDLRGLGGHGDIGPGVLPLLSLTMHELWQNREGDRLTRHAYTAFRGVSEVVRTTAEEVYSALDTGQRRTTENLFRRMTMVGPDGSLTKRPVPRGELNGTGADHEAVLERFTAKRLVMLDERTAEIAHDSLLRYWPRLRGWLEADLRSLALRSQLVDDAAEWDRNDQDASFLYRGTRLENIEHDEAAMWSEDPDRFPPLDETTLSFLESARRHATRRRRVRRLVTGGVAGSLVVALVLALVAVYEGQRVIEQQNRALSLKLAADSREAASRNGSLAQLLAAAAWQLSETDEAWTAMTNAVNNPVVSDLSDLVDGEVEQLSFSPDGTTLAIGASGGTVTTWNSESFEWHDLVAPPNAVNKGLTFSPDGSMLAIITYREVSIWDVAAENIAWRVPVTDAAEIAFSPDGTKLYTAAKTGDATAWNITDRERVATTDINEDKATAIDVSGHGTVTKAVDERIRTWDIESGEQLMSTTWDATVESIDVDPSDPDRSMICNASTCDLWDADEGAPKPVPGAARDGRFSPDGKLIATTFTNDNLGLWDTERRTLVGILPNNDQGVVSDFAFNPDRPTIAVGTVQGLRLWSLDQLSAATTMKPVESPRALAFGEAGARLVEVGRSDVRAWNVDGSPDVTTDHALPDADVSAVSPDGTLLARVPDASEDHIAIMNPATGEVTRRLDDDFQPSPALGFSSDAALLAAGEVDANTVRVWDTSSGKKLLSLKGSDNSTIEGVAISPDGSMIAASEVPSGAVRIWDRAAGELEATLPGGREATSTLAFSPDGSRLVGGTSKGISLWDLDSGEHQSFTLGVDDTWPDGVDELRYSPTGEFVAAITSRQNAVVWDPERRTTLATIPLDLSDAHSLAISPDGSSVATSGHNLRIDDLGFLEDPHAAVCEQAGRDLTKAEWKTYLDGIPYGSMDVCG